MLSGTSARLDTNTAPARRLTISDLAGWSSARLLLVRRLFVERTDRFRNGFQPCAGNCLATEIGNAVRPLFDLAQRTLHTFQAREISHHPISVKLEQRELLGFVLVFTRAIATAGPDVLFVRFIGPRERAKGGAEADEIRALLREEAGV